MKIYEVKLSSKIEEDFYTLSAANSVDLNIKEPYTHNLKVQCDLDKPWNILLIQGASGSGKSTLMKKMFGEDCCKNYLDLDRPVISQFPSKFTYQDRVDYLTASGISSIPSWVIPAKVLSNGQQIRASIALHLAHTSENEVVCIDEFSSVLDRPISKILSHSVQKFIRSKNRKVVFSACHRDLVEFLNPDHVIDCDTQEYIDRREFLRQPRTEKLNFEVRRVDKRTWGSFAKFHYLASTLPGGLGFYYGLFSEGTQIGFCSFSNYVPHRKHSKLILHGSRFTIRPDYVGMGLSTYFLNACAEHLHDSIVCDIRATYSSQPMARAMMKNSKWKLISTEIVQGKADSTVMRKNDVDYKTFSRLKKPNSFRGNCRLYKFHWIP